METREDISIQAFPTQERALISVLLGVMVRHLGLPEEETYTNPRFGFGRIIGGDGVGDGYPRIRLVFTCDEWQSESPPREITICEWDSDGNTGFVRATPGVHAEGALTTLNHPSWRLWTDRFSFGSGETSEHDFELVRVGNNQGAIKIGGTTKASIYADSMVFSQYFNPVYTDVPDHLDNTSAEGLWVTYFKDGIMFKRGHTGPPEAIG